MRGRLRALRLLNIGFANLLIVAHAGLLAYLLAAWSAVDLLGAGSHRASWFALAVIDAGLALGAGVALGLLVYWLNHLALRTLGPLARERWAMRLGMAAFAAVALGGVTGAVELYLHRPAVASALAL